MIKTARTFPAIIIQKITTYPGGSIRREKIAIDADVPAWCAALCPRLSKGLNGRSREAFRCEKYNFDLRSKQGNPVRCKKCRELFGSPQGGRYGQD